MNSRQRWSDVQVGLLVLASLAILVTGSLWVAGRARLGPGMQSYIVAMKDASGLQPGDRVRVAGVGVGRIQKIELLPEDPAPVRLSVLLRPDVRLHQGARARVSTSGLLGAPFLAIEPGRAEAPPLNPGSQVEGEAAAGLDRAMEELAALSAKSQALLDQVSSLLDLVSAQAEPLLVQLNALVSSDNVERIESVLERLDDTLARTSPRIESLLTRLDGLAARADAGLEPMPDLTRELSALTSDLRRALGPDGERLERVLGSAESSLDAAGNVLGVLADGREDLEWMLQDLRDAVSNLKQFSREVKERPFSLVRIKVPAERPPGGGGADKQR